MIKLVVREISNGKVPIYLLRDKFFNRYFRILNDTYKRMIIYNCRYISLFR